MIANVGATCSCCGLVDGEEHEGVMGSAVDPISGLCLDCQPSCVRCGGDLHVTTGDDLVVRTYCLDCKAPAPSAPDLRD